MREGEGGRKGAVPGGGEFYVAPEGGVGRRRGGGRLRDGRADEGASGREAGRVEGDGEGVAGALEDTGAGGGGLGEGGHRYLPGWVLAAGVDWALSSFSLARAVAAKGERGCWRRNSS